VKTWLSPASFSTALAIRASGRSGGRAATWIFFEEVLKRRSRERGGELKVENAQPVLSQHQKIDLVESSPNHLCLNVIDSSCPIDGPEGDVDGDAKVELAFDDGNPCFDDHGSAAHEFGLA